MSQTFTSVDKDSATIVANIVARYVSNNSVQPFELRPLILDLYATLRDMRQSPSFKPNLIKKLTNSQISKSIRPDALISFEDGKSYKTLRRHLAVRGLTPESYRKKWGLPESYPLISASYSARRSEIAKTSINLEKIVLKDDSQA